MLGSADSAAVFISITPQAAPQPRELPKSRVALPCRGPTPPRSLTVFTFDEARLGAQPCLGQSHAAGRGTALGAHHAIPVKCLHESR